MVRYCTAGLCKLDGGRVAACCGVGKRSAVAAPHPVTQLLVAGSMGCVHATLAIYGKVQFQYTVLAHSVVVHSNHGLSNVSFVGGSS